MACKADVREAVLSKVFEELTEGRYTFSRISNDTIQINNRVDNSKSKATSNKQAKAIAEELVSRVKESFNGHVTGFISQHSAFDPVTISFSVSDAYINHVYNSLPVNQRTQAEEVGDERSMVLSDTGYNTHTQRQLTLFSPSEEPTVGVYAKYIMFKKSQLQEYKRRLAKIATEKKKKDITTERLNKLNNLEREITHIIEGKFELGIKGLQQEIMELEKQADAEALAYYVQKDLQRLDRLATSNNIDDLREAQRIIDFYDLAGTFDWTKRNDNPFFSSEEIFLIDEDGNLTNAFRLSEETMNQYKEWRNTALGYQNIIDKRKEELTVETVNTDPSVKNTYGDKEFSFHELIYGEKGLKDADWISMWTMDVTKGIFSHNGILPQVMFSYLSNSFEKKLAWAREIEEKIDRMSPGVQKELMKLGYSLRGAGILGIKGASYQLFKEISKEGNETGGIVQRFVKEFFDEQSKAMNLFRERFDHAKLITDYTQKQRAYNKAFEEMKKWRRNNTIILDITRIPEILSNPEFAEFNHPTVTTTHAEDYKKELITILGEKGYKEQVEKQTLLLKKYLSEKQTMIDTLLLLEGKSTYDELSDKGKSDISYWEHNHNPVRGYEDYHSVPGLFFGNRKANSFMDFNTFIPRKYKTNIKHNTTTSQYEFQDTTELTGNYSEAFATIEGNQVLSEFYDTIKEVVDTIRENTPPELQAKMAANTLPGLMKTSAEFIADKNTGIMSALWLSFKHLIERIRVGFGVVKQSELSYATIDPITGRPNYKVNDNFLSGNTTAVNNRMTIEKSKFIQAFNSTRPPEQRLNTIRRFTILPISGMNASSLVLLAQYLHVDISLADIQAGRIDAIKAKTGENVEIGKYIKDFSIHSVVQSQSFDLAKLSKYFSNMTMAYAARQEALPIMEIMKKHYESIQKPDTNNMDNQLFNVLDEKHMKVGLRTNAIKQMDDWFNRVALDNYGLKHKGVFGKENKDGEVPFFGKTIYTNEERKQYEELQALIDNEVDEKKKIQLRKIQSDLGRVRTATAFWDNMLNWIRTLRLGYNVSSATTNFLEGVTSNMILGASDRFFDPKELFYGYSVIKHSFIKNLTFGMAETGLAKKNRSLMDKFNVIMDSKNELQKSSVKTYASRFSWMNPHELNQRVEYINQSPLMIAMLRTIKIKDKDGNESSVWDAYSKEGHLKEEFRTEENIENWENLSGQEYLNFKQKLMGLIVMAHGNYHELRGMMIKSNSAGKALMMFKTWIPMQIYQRIGVQQDDIQTGTIGYRGRYFSFGKGSGAVYGATVGTAVFGPVGTVIGGITGGLLGGIFGTNSVGMITEIVETTKQLALKAFGMPVNLLAGRKIIGGTEKAFESWVGKGEFTTQDAHNMRSNMADISLQLAWLGLILLTKSLFWDDEDEPNDPDRITHNILVNKLMQLSSQAAMYINPVDAFQNTLGSNAVIQYLTDVGKTIVRVNEAVHGRDTIQSGQNAGESGLKNQLNKTFLPGIFKDNMFGFGTQAEKVFEESPFHPYFKSDATIDKEDNKRDRAEMRRKLEEELKVEDYGGDEKAKERDIRKIIDQELPTPTKLKKLGVSREEYEQSKTQ